ncbi:outer membrane protein assembly factor BamC [Microbulbifer hydrolyticus]|uniref:Outer membrane protein assembly factor BamC n=1 Tax=Microbulbifer hydrolyticus TaxID=48074 RepID=A0A6P1TD40_9GAMM|nr:outer membrane protein assembly factor BamC [Microbulbifer hydrolyticus]MBB5212255.1 outer membrane protein assembly factor BamC [Microbulbifer hydrolyticus]QHQ39907.1 outer membrane protein assembly factor BamC [Microbulbifer hydrolyticus]
MTKFTAGAVLCAAVTTLSGCGIFGQDGYFRDRGDDYQLADTLPPLQMPEGVSAKHQEELYEVPQISGEVERGDFVVPRPQALSVNVGLDRVKIQKLGNRRWVLVNQPPDEVWPQLHYFLRSTGLQLAMSDAGAGTMETTWLTFGENPDTKDKYRLQVESGVQPDTTEIHVRHLSVPMDAPVDGAVSWPAQSSSPEREGWMIDEMSGALAAESTGAAASLVAQAIGGGKVKVQVMEPAGKEPYIALDLAMNRAWATVSHALNTGAYRLHKQDADIGILYVTYDSERELADEEGGWFSSWGSGSGGDKLAKSADAYSLQQVLANIDMTSTAEPALFANMQGLGGAPNTNIPGYLVVLRGVDNVIEVRIRSTRGLPLSRAKASEMLMAIRQNLI